MKNIEIQTQKQALLSERTLLLSPCLAAQIGIVEALVVQQIYYLSGVMQHKGLKINATRTSYTRLQKHLPFLTRRWLIEKIQKLELKKIIQVTRTNRVNLLALTEDTRKFMVIEEELKSTKMIVFPSLAKELGIPAAVLMQQVHLRTYEMIEEHGVIMSTRRWNEDVCSFFSVSTIQRALAKLNKQALIVVTSFRDEIGSTNCYRINYANLGSMLKLPQ